MSNAPHATFQVESKKRKVTCQRTGEVPDGPSAACLSGISGCAREGDGVGRAGAVRVGGFGPPRPADQYAASGEGVRDDTKSRVHGGAHGC